MNLESPKNTNEEETLPPPAGPVGTAGTVTITEATVPVPTEAPTKMAALARKFAEMVPTLTTPPDKMAALARKFAPTVPPLSTSANVSAWLLIKFASKSATTHLTFHKLGETASGHDGSNAPK